MSHLKTLSESQRTLLGSALTLAAEKYDENAAVFVKLAADLRAGGEHPMFARGEAGARAADRLADQFRHQAKDARKMRETIAFAREVRVTLDEVEDESEDES